MKKLLKKTALAAVGMLFAAATSAAFAAFAAFLAFFSNLTAFLVLNGAFPSAFLKMFSVFLACSANFDCFFCFLPFNLNQYD